MGTARNANVDVYSMDMSGFDTSLSEEALNIVRNLVKGWFTPDDGYLVDKEWDVILNCPLISPYGVLDRNGSMPSGVVWTNVADSLWMLICLHYVAAVMDISLLDFEVMGDDSLAVFSPATDIAEISDHLQDLGMKVNESKTMVSADACHYLQKLYSQDYSVDGVMRGVRSPFRIMSGVTGFERWHTRMNPDWNTVRWVMQAENCKWDPRFKELVRFIRDGDDNLGNFLEAKVAKAARDSELRAAFGYSGYEEGRAKIGEFNSFRFWDVLYELT